MGCFISQNLYKPLTLQIYMRSGKKLFLYSNKLKHGESCWNQVNQMLWPYFHDRPTLFESVTVNQHQLYITISVLYFEGVMGMEWRWADSRHLCLPVEQQVGQPDAHWYTFNTDQKKNNKKVWKISSNFFIHFDGF